MEYHWKIPGVRQLFKALLSFYSFFRTWGRYSKLYHSQQSDYVGVLCHPKTFSWKSCGVLTEPRSGQQSRCVCCRSANRHRTVVHHWTELPGFVSKRLWFMAESRNSCVEKVKNYLIWNKVQCWGLKVLLFFIYMMCQLHCIFKLVVLPRELMVNNKLAFTACTVLLWVLSSAYLHFKVM